SPGFSDGQIPPGNEDKARYPGYGCFRPGAAGSPDRGTVPRDWENTERWPPSESDRNHRNGAVPEGRPAATVAFPPPQRHAALDPGLRSRAPDPVHDNPVGIRHG